MPREPRTNLEALERLHTNRRVSAGELPRPQPIRVRRRAAENSFLINSTLEESFVNFISTNRGEKLNLKYRVGDRLYYCHVHKGLLTLTVQVVELDHYDRARPYNVQIIGGDHDGSRTWVPEEKLSPMSAIRKRKEIKCQQK